MKQLKVTNGINRISFRMEGQTFSIKRRKDGYLIFCEENKIALVREEGKMWAIHRPDHEEILVRLQKEEKAPFTRPKKVEKISFCLNDRDLWMISSGRSICVREAGEDVMTISFGWLRGKLYLLKETMDPEETVICLTLAKCMDKSNEIDLV